MPGVKEEYWLLANLFPQTIMVSSELQQLLKTYSYPQGTQPSQENHPATSDACKSILI